MTRTPAPAVPAAPVPAPAAAPRSSTGNRARETIVQASRSPATALPSHAAMASAALQMLGDPSLWKALAPEMARVESEKRSKAALDWMTKDVVGGHRQQLKKTGVGTHYGNESPLAKALEKATTEKAKEQILAKYVKDHARGGTAPLPPQITSCVRFVSSVVERYATPSAGVTSITTPDPKDFAERVMEPWKASKERGTVLARGLHDFGWTVLMHAPTPKASASMRAEEKRAAKEGRQPLYPPKWSSKVATSDPRTPYDARLKDLPGLLGVPGRRDPTGLKALKKLPFAVLILEDGMHTAILHNGKVTEQHWKRQPTSTTVFETTPVDKFLKGWDSAIVVVPPGALSRPTAPTTATGPAAPQRH
jgi:hypothetical protein